MFEKKGLKIMLENAKISCFADEIDTDLNIQIDVLRELKLQFIEFRSANHKGIADYTIAEALKTRKTLDHNGIAVSAIGSPTGKIRITDDFASHFKQFQHTAELADIFETPYIRMFSFYLPKNSPPQIHRDEVLKRLDLLVNYAAKKNLVLLHENEKGIYGDTAIRCLELMKEFFGPNFGATFDFANFLQCGQDTLEAYDTLKPYIVYLHIKDAIQATGEIVTAGNGDGQIPSILNQLDKGGYSGYLSLEPHLVDFDALKSLEQEGTKRGRTDGPEAFRTAYRALLKILH